MSEKRDRRKWSPERKAEIVLAGLRGERSVRDVCREHEIAETLFYQWRDKLLEGGTEALRSARERAKDPREQELKDAKRRVAQLERARGKKTYELEVAGKALVGWECPRVQSPCRGCSGTSTGGARASGPHLTSGDLADASSKTAGSGPRTGVGLRAGDHRGRERESGRRYADGRRTCLPGAR